MSTLKKEIDINDKKEVRNPKEEPKSPFIGKTYSRKLLQKAFQTDRSEVEFREDFCETFGFPSSQHPDFQAAVATRQVVFP